MAAKEIGTRLPGAALEAAERLQVRVEQTRLLVETLTQMKGAAMKAGQLLSLEGQDFLPPEVLEVLQGLQSEAKFMPESEVQRILQNELGPKLASLSVHPSPIAAASIGQVHRAT
ncbi:MAG: AarF/UbiB family protein, partial [Bacteroidota bacterium]